MGLFSSGKRLHLSKGELRDLLDNVSGLDNEAEEAIVEALERYQSGGLSKQEIKDAMRKLKYSHDDPVARDEAKRARKALLAALEGE